MNILDKLMIRKRVCVSSLAVKFLAWELSNTLLTQSGAVVLSLLPFIF